MQTTPPSLPARRDRDDDKRVGSVHSHSSEIQKFSEQNHCEYCNTPLDPFYYFCLSCSAPYVPADQVVVPEQAEYINDAQKIEQFAPQAFPLFWSYFGVLISSVVMMVISGAENSEMGISLFAMAGILMVTVYFGANNWDMLLKQFRVVGFDQWEGKATVLAVVPLLLLVFAYQFFLSVVAPDIKFSDPSGEAGMPLFAAVLMICVFPAVTEEIGFRGMLQPWLVDALGKKEGIMLASALFAALHLTVIGFPILFLVGMTLGYARYHTKSLYPGMALHFTYNLGIVLFS